MFEANQITKYWEKLKNNFKKNIDLEAFSSLNNFVEFSL